MDPGTGSESSLTVNEQVFSGPRRGEDGGPRDSGKGGGLHKAPQHGFQTKFTATLLVQEKLLSLDFSGAKFGDLSCDFKIKIRVHRYI